MPEIRNAKKVRQLAAELREQCALYGVTLEEQHDLHVLLKILATIDPWLGLLGSDEPSGALAVRPRSPLSTDDARTHPYRVSHRAWMAIPPAVGFLACLRGSLIGARQQDELEISGACAPGAATAVLNRTPRDASGPRSHASGGRSGGLCIDLGC